MGVNLLEHLPAAYCALMRRRHPEWLLVTSDSDIVIEGYQSSGNTFARKAMAHANPTVRIASHAHSWAHVAQGVRRGKPVVVLLREPREVIASHVVRMRLEDLDLEIERYIGFYRGVEPLAARVVLAPFAVTTTRFGDVIRAVNQKFGRSFIPFPDDASAVAAVFDEMEREVRSSPPATDLAWRIARPHPARHEASASIRQRLSAERYRRRLAVCDALYGRLLEAAGDLSDDRSLRGGL
jgi:hypothetical protein